MSIIAMGLFGLLFVVLGATGLATWCYILVSACRMGYEQEDGEEG